MAEPLSIEPAIRPDHRDLVVIGGSAGALEPLREIISELPADFPAAILVCLHLAPSSRSSSVSLGRMLQSFGRLPAYDAQDGESIRCGEIYAAVPDYHLLVHQGRLLLRRGPRENYARPAIDALFRSAAVEYGGRVIAVVLSGEGVDGTDGMMAVRRCGGVGLAQLPAVSQSMPTEARDAGRADEAVPASELAAVLARRVAEAPGSTPADVSPDLLHQVRVARQEQSPMGGRMMLPTALACPRCEGPLWEARDGGIVKYECEIGHAFEPEEIEASRRLSAESALWTAVRMNEERARFNRHLARHEQGGGRATSAAALEARGSEYEAQAEVLRRLILSSFAPGGNGGGSDGRR